ncbi:hypothetical protein [Clostridium perfringens]|uniref:hypothetical protein n=1 Tax=Clostridium perfringens TaxID=1502 RepID=UPI00096A8C5C|nr:hypothetical protein [Clostridium perfringens]MDK0953135.1 hypothetical protein [Clostridium perfringens]
MFEWMKNKLLIWSDLISKRDRSNNVDWQGIFKGYCELIEESTYLHNQYYYYLNNNDYKMINYYEDKINDINKKIQDYQNKYPWVEQEYNRYL